MGCTRFLRDFGECRRGIRKSIVVMITWGDFDPNLSVHKSGFTLARLNGSKHILFESDTSKR
jgi:hypothetical protein